MRAVSIVALAAVISAVMLPAAAHSQGTSSEVLVRKVDSLQLMVSELESRIAALENLVRVTPRGPVVDAAPNARDIGSWRRLSENMTMDDVRSLLGEPEKIDGGSMAVWYYPRGGEVIFMFGRLSRWSEPSR